MADIVKTQKHTPNYELLRGFLTTKFSDTTGQKFKFKHIKKELVFHHLESLNTNKAAGFDGLSPKILKLSAGEISSSLSHIINLSLKHNVFPNTLKAARVRPFFRSGDKELPENYRPISVLGVISKIIEKHVAKQISKYLQENHLLHQHESWFTQFHSCQFALIKLIDEWLFAIGKGNFVGAVFLDMEKAFDLVDYNIL